MNNDKILEEIRKLCDPYSLLVISGHRLIRLKCPFRVRLLEDVSGWKEGEELVVDKIMITRDLLMVYLIRGNAYPYYLFRLVI